MPILIGLILALIAVLALVAQISTSAASAQQAQAAIEASRAAQISAAGQTGATIAITVLVVLLVVVLLVAGFAALYFWSQSHKPAKKGKWAPGPNAGFRRLDQEEQPWSDRPSLRQYGLSDYPHLSPEQLAQTIYWLNQAQRSRPPERQFQSLDDPTTYSNQWPPNR